MPDSLYYNKVVCIKKYGTTTEVGEVYYITKDMAPNYILSDNQCGIYKTKVSSNTLVSLVNKKEINEYFVDEIKYKLDILLGPIAHSVRATDS